VIKDIGGNDKTGKVNLYKKKKKKKKNALIASRCSSVPLCVRNGPPRAHTFVNLQHLYVHAPRLAASVDEEEREEKERRSGLSTERRGTAASERDREEGDQWL